MNTRGCLCRYHACTAKRLGGTPFSSFSPVAHLCRKASWLYGMLAHILQGVHPAKALACLVCDMNLSPTAFVLSNYCSHSPRTELVRPLLGNGKETDTMP